MSGEMPASVLHDAQNLLELEALAKAVLPPMAYDYFASGADDELTLRRNRAAFAEVELHPRVMVDVSRCSAATSVLGTALEWPVLIAPMAFQRMAHPDGEVATARAAAAAGSAMVVSTLATTRLEDVIAASATPVWFQLYLYRDRQASRELVARAEAAGAKALVLTVDAPRLGRRERDVRNRFTVPAPLRAENVHGVGGGLDRPADDSGLASYFYSLIDPALTWSDVTWLRGITRLPILLKGVLRPDDAKRAVAAGAHGLVISNHGGRQLDTAPAAIDVLPRIAEAVDGRAELLFDGGVRRGTDVIKALALGAKAVLVGRPILWGLALGGQAGAVEVLAMLRRELELAMALCGCPDVESITSDLVEARRK